MRKPFVSDKLWAIVEPLLPAPKPRRRRFPGRTPADRRAVLEGIIYVAKTGLPWRDLPREVAGVSGNTCWDYLDAWTKAGVWPAVHEALLANLHAADKIDWSRVSVCRAPRQLVQFECSARGQCRTK